MTETLEISRKARHIWDVVEPGDRVLYARLPNGIAGSRLPDWERLLGLIVTVRNWNTVTRLRDLVTEAAAG